MQENVPRELDKYSVINYMRVAVGAVLLYLSLENGGV